MAVITPDTKLYTELYDYITKNFDTRPSTAKRIITELPTIIEKLTKQIEGNSTITIGNPISPIPEDFGPIPKTIDVLY